MKPTLYGTAVYKCVTRHGLRAMTHGNMFNHFANGAGTTCSRAGINTLLVHAGTIPGTLGTQHTLGTTGDVRITLIIRKARALSVTRANGIVATGTWIAGIALFLIGRRGYIELNTFNLISNRVSA